MSAKVWSPDSLSNEDFLPWMAAQAVRGVAKGMEWSGLAHPIDPKRDYVNPYELRVLFKRGHEEAAIKELVRGLQSRQVRCFIEHPPFAMGWNIIATSHKMGVSLVVAQEANTSEVYELVALVSLEDGSAR